jgi:Flp pilus assembly protein TadG
MEAVVARVDDRFTPRRGERPQRRRERAVSMVEFALLAPVAFLILMGLVVTGIVVTNEVALSNGVRDIARAAAVCGSIAGRPPSTGTDPQLPATGGQSALSCSWTNLQTYVSARMKTLTGGGAITAPTGSFGTNCLATSGASGIATVEVCVYDSSGNAVALDTSGAYPLDACAKGYSIEVSAQDAQPLYLPLVGRFLGSNGTTNRNLTADARATCED